MSPAVIFSQTTRGSTPERRMSHMPQDGQSDPTQVPHTAASEQVSIRVCGVQQGVLPPRYVPSTP